MAQSQSKATVTKGGMWDTQTPMYSKETQELLKVMMKESRLTSFQQRQLNSAMRDGSSLPLKCNPTSSAKPVKKSSPKPKVTIKEYQPSLRSKEEIEATGAYERPRYVPGYSKCKEKEKTRLANYMAYGKDFPDPTPEERAKILEPPSPEPDIDRFSQLEQEVRERAEFLDDMRALGRAKEYESIIQTEISQKIREMKDLDKQRTAELQRLLEGQESN